MEDDQFGGVVTGGEPVVVVEQFQVVGMAVLIVDREQERCAAGIEKRFQSEIVVIIVVSGGLVVQVTGGVSGFFEEGREKGTVRSRGLQAKRGLTARTWSDSPGKRHPGKRRVRPAEAALRAGGWSAADNRKGSNGAC